MPNPYEQPWALLAAAVLSLFVVLTIRSVWPEKHRFWQWLIPATLALLAFGIDALVQTDIERINVLLKTALRAVQNEDCSTIATLIANNYADSHHRSKADLLRHCANRFTDSPVERARRTGSLIELADSEARVTIFSKLTFRKDSYIARDYKPWILVKARLYLRKHPPHRWLIHNIRLLEIDKQPVNWSTIR